MNITTETGNVVPDLFYAGTLVPKADVLYLTRHARKAKDVEAIVDGDDNYILGNNQAS